jgi:hypothetical protein
MTSTLASSFNTCFSAPSQRCDALTGSALEQLQTLDPGRSAKPLLSTTMFDTTFSSNWNWQRLFSYAEVVCFVSAWAVGLFIAMQGQHASSDRVPPRSFASASDAIGIQAKLR